MPKITTKQIIRSQKQAANAPTSKDQPVRGTGGFLMNKDLGQHILKNPLVVNGIVEKVQF